MLKGVLFDVAISVAINLLRLYPFRGLSQKV